MIQSQIGSEMLSPEEIQAQELWSQYVASSTLGLREALILQYLPLVKYVMGRIAISLPVTLDFEDILSVGTIGLVEAVDRFDPNYGVKFQTYAIARIKGAMIDELRKSDRLSRSTRQKMKKIEEAESRLFQELGREPTEEEIMEDLGMKERVFRETTVQAGLWEISIEKRRDPFNDSSNDVDAYNVRDPDEPPFTRALEQVDLRRFIFQNLSKLPFREAVILELYYWTKLTMREIGERMHISESRVCRIHAKALVRLRADMPSKGR